MLLSSPHDLSSTPQRIVSLVPSQTELLYDLGLEKETVGITKFCVHPEEWFRTKTRVGGTKSIKKDIIDQLQPDLIIANKEENVKEQVEELAKDHPVWVSDIHDLDGALQMIMDVCRLTGKITKTKQIIHQIKLGFIHLKNIQQQTQHRKPKTAYLIWRNPYMTIGGDTFINDMLERCGLENIFRNKTRYPSVTVEELKDAGCELLLLSSEPYPFKQDHINELQSQLPGCKIMLVDGEMFSWYGSRLLKAPAYFQQLLQSL
jgi:ABC-type Fe3+-hydroxamate transport system substrate-binding protein